jgi:hypothetical protein
MITLLSCMLYYILIVFRILRIFKYVNYLKKIHSQNLIINALQGSLTELILIFLLIFVFMTVFAFISQALFADTTEMICIPQTVYDFYQLILINPNITFPSDAKDDYVLEFCGGRYTSMILLYIIVFVCNAI